jgi:hypothetical protein
MAIKNPRALCNYIPGKQDAAQYAIFQSPDLACYLYFWDPFKKQWSASNNSPSIQASASYAFVSEVVIPQFEDWMVRVMRGIQEDKFKDRRDLIVYVRELEGKDLRKTVEDIVKLLTLLYDNHGNEKAVKILINWFPDFI